MLGTETQLSDMGNPVCPFKCAHRETVYDNMLSEMGTDGRGVLMYASPVFLRGALDASMGHWPLLLLAQLLHVHARCWVSIAWQHHSLPTCTRAHCSAP